MARLRRPDVVPERLDRQVAARVVQRGGLGLLDPGLAHHGLRAGSPCGLLEVAEEQSCEPTTTSPRGGHANTSVTLQIYTHRSVGRDQAMSQTLGEIIQTAIGSSHPGSPSCLESPNENAPAGPSVGSRD